MIDDAHEPQGGAAASKAPAWMCRHCLADSRQAGEVSTCRGDHTSADAPPAPHSGRLTRCPHCARPGLTQHSELFDLAIAHIDCDAFYAAVEKRDNPELAGKPVIIGGGQRGVVATACYVARTRGVRSAMPMFKALTACPEAVVIRPNMAKYSEVGQQVRQAMQALTPVVQPLSIDEAFLDLSGTQALHRRPPAIVLRDFQQQVERDLGISVSVGLSYNKLMAKIASDLQKPRGFSVLGQADGPAFLAQQDLSILWGVGKVTVQKMNKRGLHKVGDLLRFSEEELFLLYGAWGKRLFYYARGQDTRAVVEPSKSKSVSNETTFSNDLNCSEDLQRKLWPLCEKLSYRLKDQGLAAKTLTLKLKDAKFRSITRSHTLSDPTASAERIYKTACELLAPEIGPNKSYRLIGIGSHGFVPIEHGDSLDLMDQHADKKRDLEKALDLVREKLGRDAPIKRGRGL